MLTKKQFSYFFIASFLVLSCKKEDNDRLGELDMSRPAAIGGNFLAGYQDGALYVKGQQLSIPALMFKSSEHVSIGDFDVPIISAEEEGIGMNVKFWESVFQTRSRLGYRLDCNNDESLGPVKQLHAGTNFVDFSHSSVTNSGYYQCIPFMTSQDMSDASFGLSLSAGNKNPYYQRWASNPGVSTPVSDLLAYNPSFATVWLGMEDIYNYAINGGVGHTIPSVENFRSNLDYLMSNLAAQGTKGVIANIPSIDHFPYFNLIPYNGANLDADQVQQLTGLYSVSGITHIQFHEGANGFVTYDQDAPSGIRKMVNGERILLTVPLDSMRCYLYGLLLEYVNDRYTLTLAEQALIRASIDGYNQVIQELADKYGFAHFDADQFFGKVNGGVKWDGANFNLAFVSGGFMSLDGLHPNQKGYLLLANGMIEAVNKKYKTRIPTMNCPDCDGVLFP